MGPQGAASSFSFCRASLDQLSSGEELSYQAPRRPGGGSSLTWLHGRHGDQQAVHTRTVKLLQQPGTEGIQDELYKESLHLVDPWSKDELYKESLHLVDPWSKDELYKESLHLVDPWSKDELYKESLHLVDPWSKDELYKESLHLVDV
ncbi:hypothetical protein NHX12_012329 [Muraenolepis orangiensis]|uniref:Uncharacterized protein n=1 Tax=Muraenolepis orangiensis TaxID=630683 RepID=A0A9Q0DCT7_9TELE|nr:hypothetical protein NHX12_012329 [Muraenolepis orangiensis]